MDSAVLSSPTLENVWDSAERPQEPQTGLDLGSALLTAFCQSTFGVITCCALFILSLVWACNSLGAA